MSKGAKSAFSEMIVSGCQLCHFFSPFQNLPTVVEDFSSIVGLVQQLLEMIYCLNHIKPFFLWIKHIDQQSPCDGFDFSCFSRLTLRDGKSCSSPVGPLTDTSPVPQQALHEVSSSFLPRPRQIPQRV